MATHHRRRFYSAALALLLASDQLSSTHATVFVCGNAYDDASLNCTVNTPCPTGDGCPETQGICFAMPDEQCFGPPTTDPSKSPTTPPSSAPSEAPLRVCGFDYNDALSNCRSNDLCPNGDSALCGDDTHACFSIPVYLCPTDAPSSAPTPTPKVCGTDSFNAQANCLDMSKRCPAGDGCPTGEACFNVPTNVCGVSPPPTLSPVAAGGGNIVGPTNPPGPTSTPTLGLIKICGANYTDATTNCNTNPLCPSGDVSFLVHIDVVCSCLQYDMYHVRAFLTELKTCANNTTTGLSNRVHLLRSTTQQLPS